MSKLREILACISIAGASALASIPPAFAEPIKDQGRILIRVEGHEETFGILSSPQHAVLDYTLAVSVAGEGLLSVFVRRPDVSGESLDDPPRITATRFRLTAPDLARLQKLLIDARIGQQADCHSSVPFFATASASLPPKQRLVWFGNRGRRHELDAWHGGECGAEVLALLRYLADTAGAAYRLPTER
jgi:hypothetical protein